MFVLPFSQSQNSVPKIQKVFFELNTQAVGWSAEKCGSIAQCVYGNAEDRTAGCLQSVVQKPSNKNIKMSSFKINENIHKKEGGPDRSVSDNQSSSVTLDELAMKA